MDLIFRDVDALTYSRIPAYAEMDLRVAWRPRPRLELAVMGQNLLDAAHQEGGFTGAGAVFPFVADPTETQRGVYGSVTYTY